MPDVTNWKFDSFDPHWGTCSTPDDGKWHLACFRWFGDETVKVYEKVPAPRGRLLDRSA